MDLNANYMQAAMRGLLRTTILLFVAICGHAAAQSALPDLVAFPKNLPPGVPTQITITWIITDPTYIAGSAVLNEIGSDNRVIRRLGTFSDNGNAGDEVAGDKKFTAQFLLNEPAERTILISASAAFRGTLLRAVSPPTFLFVNSDTNLRLGQAVVSTEKIEFRDSTGTVVRSEPLASHEKTAVALPAGAATLTTTDIATEAESQLRVGVVTQRHLRLNNAHEGDNSTSTFRYFSSSGTLLFSRESSEDRTFFVSPDARYLSRSGHRVLLVEVDENESNPSVKLLDDHGAILGQLATIPGLGVIREAQLSSTGQYIGLTGYVSPGGNETVVVVDTDTFAISQRVSDPSNALFMSLEENVGGSFNVVRGNTVGEQLP